MADEKTPPTSSSSGGDVDLKARLRLSSKSRRQQAQEEEERLKAQEEAKKKAETDRTRREQERQEQFSLAGGGDVRAEWSAHWAVPDEEELKKLEALPEQGKRGRTIVLGILLFISLAFALGVGYYFGRAFFGRTLENAKIEEAREIIAFHNESRKAFFDAVADHQKKINDLVETFQKPDLDPNFQLRQLYAFLQHCEKFLENQPISARELFGGQIHNADIAPELVMYVDSLNRMFMMTDQMLKERGILMLVGTGEDDEQPEEKLLVYAAFEPDPRGDPVKIPWNKGDIIAIPAESWKNLKPIEPGATPKEGGEDVPATPAEAHYSMPVQKGTKAEIVEVDTANIVEFDAWPVIRRQAALYRLAMLERAKGTLMDLKAISDKVQWSRVETKLQEYAQKETYFSL